MTTTKINRRTALLGTAALPAAVAPLGLARAAASANATDAAWADYQAAKAEDHARKAAYRAWEAENVPERLHSWERERDTYRNPHDLDDDELDAFLDPINEAQFSILKTPAATVTDVERASCPSSPIWRGRTCSRLTGSRASWPT